MTMDLDEDELIAEPEEEQTPLVTSEPELPPVAKEEKPEPKPVKEHVKESVPTINERMSAQLGERNGMADHISMQPVSDLKAAINMNDKLLFVKDLFNGYSLAYSEAVEILNRFSNFEEADLITCAASRLKKKCV